MRGAGTILHDFIASVSRYRLDEEAYKWSSARFYRDLWRPNNYVDWPDNPYNSDKWFGSDLTSRIYLKFGNELEKTEVELDIEAKLDEAGYDIVDYDKNRCRKKGDKPENQPKITGILAKIDKTGKLVNKFNKDAENRKGRIANPEVKGKMVVISRHPYDIAGMTTGRSWYDQSCMRHDDPINQCGGAYHPAVISDILRGTLVAYFADEKDTNLKNPIARLLIKPYYTESGKVYLRQSTRCYPNQNQEAFPPQARQALEKWLVKQQEDLTEFAYFKDGSAEHSSGHNPISARMSPQERLRIINTKVKAGLYKDRGDTGSIPPSVPTEQLLKRLNRIDDGAKMVASWVDNGKLDIDTPYLYVADASGNYGIFEYVGLRKRIKSITALKFVADRMSVLGRALQVAWETDIPRYLEVIQKNPDMLSLPILDPHYSNLKRRSIAQYLLQNHAEELKKILSHPVLEYLKNEESRTYADLVISGLIPPSDPRWYLQVDPETGYTNAYQIFEKRGYELSVLEEIPLPILMSLQFLESPTSSHIQFMDRLLDNMRPFYTDEPDKYPQLVQVVDRILASSRKMRDRGLNSQVRIFSLLSSFSSVYLPKLLDLYGQDSSMLRLRDSGSSEKTLAHLFAEYEPRWVPDDKSILALRYIDSGMGRSVSVLDVIRARKGKIGRYLQKRIPVRTPPQQIPDIIPEEDREID